MDATLQVNEAGKVVIKPLRQEAPAEVLRDREIESIKRTLYNAIDKLERIQQRKEDLITT